MKKLHFANGTCKARCFCTSAFGFIASRKLMETSNCSIWLDGSKSYRQSDEVFVDPGKMGMQYVHGVKQLFINGTQLARLYHSLRNEWMMFWDVACRKRKTGV
jgi:hypothetical protein